MTLHVTEVAPGAGPGRGQGARVVQLLLGLDDPGRGRLEHVLHPPPVPDEGVVPRGLGPPGRPGELPPPVLLVFLIVDHIDVAPHELDVAPGEFEDIFERIDLLIELGLQTELEVVEC